jgi:hypothetical protein
LEEHHFCRLHAITLQKTANLKGITSYTIAEAVTCWILTMMVAQVQSQGRIPEIFGQQNGIGQVFLQELSFAINYHSTILMLHFFSCTVQDWYNGPSMYEVHPNNKKGEKLYQKLMAEPEYLTVN